jgi:hypothetical protein
VLDRAGLLAGGEVHDTHDSAVRVTVQNHQFAEVFVQRDKNPGFAVACLKISSSPGSCGQSPAQATSWPWERSPSAALPHTHVSSNNFM